MPKQPKYISNPRLAILIIGLSMIRSVSYKHLLPVLYGLWNGRIMACLAGIVLISCTDMGKDSKAYVLTFWSSNNPHEIKHAREVVARWNDIYPQWPVKYQPIPEGRSSEEVLLAAIVSKTTPDIYSNLWPGSVQQYREADILLRLDTLPGFDSLYTSRLPVELRDQFKSKDGTIYQMPWKSNPIVYYYNKNHFKAAGIEPPLVTYSEFLAAAQKLTRDLNGDGFNDRWMMDIDINVEWWHRWFDFYTLFIAASGGQTLLDSGGGINFQSPAGLAVFDFLRKGFQQGYFLNALLQEDPFLQERVAMHISGPWNVAQLEKFRPEGFEYGFMPIPVPDDYTGDAYTYGDAKNIAIFSATTRPRIAWKFVQFMVSRENDKRLLEITKQLPLRAGLLTDPLFRQFFDQYPKYRFFAEMLPNTVGVDQSIYLPEIFDAISQEFDAACVHAVKTTAAGLEDATERCQALLAREEF